MGRLSIDKQEKFASYLANGYTQVAAYVASGYSSKGSTAAANASKLANDEDVMKRIEELKIKAAERNAMSEAPPLPIGKRKGHGDIDIDWINNEYIALLNKAKEIDDIKNAVIIVKEMSELNNVRPEPAPDNNINKNRMLPSNDKSNMGSKTFIQIVNQESKNDGGGSNGFVEITIPDSDSISDGDYATYEDLGDS